MLILNPRFAVKKDGCIWCRIESEPAYTDKESILSRRRELMSDTENYNKYRIIPHKGFYYLYKKR